MKKALCLASSNSGRGDKDKIDRLVKSRLLKVFDVFDFIKIVDLDSILTNLPSLLKDYDYLIVLGGDGTFNHIVGEVSKLGKNITIGYIPTGTICDCRSVFGVPKSIKKAIKIIENQYTGLFDLVSIGDKRFVYMASFGAYSSISYDTKRSAVKKYHSMSYYFASIKEAFHKTRVNYSFKINGKTYTGVAPFILFLNGKKVGGFSINRSSSSKDGLFEVYLTKNTFFNGLLCYLPIKFIKPIKTNKVEILESSSIWCLDGEKEEIKAETIEIMPKCMRFFSSKKLSD